MEYLLFAVILYFILRTVSNLVGLLRGTEAGSPGGGRRGVASQNGHQWEGPSPRQHTGSARDEPTYWDKDIEDATWYDVDDPSTVS